jgi:hypothetical protein
MTIGPGHSNGDDGDLKWGQPGVRPKVDRVQLERGLQRIQGVRSVRVVGDEAPSEIHVIATQERTPKQVVRDVQSMAQAGFGMPIDHRIVSVVQLDDPAAQEAEAQPPSASRPVIDRVIQSNGSESGWVKIVLRWPDGSTTEGEGAAGASREARAQAALQAVIGALQPWLDRREARIDVEHLLIQKIGTTDSVPLWIGLWERGVVTPLVGSVVVRDDVATASVRALLHAINRKLH